MECWYQSEYLVKDKFDCHFADPLFIYNFKKGIEVYYHKENIKSHPAKLLKYYLKNWESGFKKETIEFLKTCKKLGALNRQFNPKNISEMLVSLIKIWPIMTDLYILFSADVSDIYMSKDVKTFLERLRKESEKVSHNSFDLILNHAENYLSLVNKDRLFYLSDFLSVDELVNGRYKKRLPAVFKRVGGTERFVYYCAKIYQGKRMRDLIREKIVINRFQKISGQKIFIGRPVCGGKVVARIKKIDSYYDLDKVKDGDIIVASDLSPEYSVMINKVSGIITEIGGRLSHAAILAREAKKPCVTGVHGITKKLFDGQRVELDGKIGKIKIV